MTACMGLGDGDILTAKASEIVQHRFQGVQNLLLPGMADEETSVAHIGMDHNCGWMLGMDQLLLSQAPGYKIILG